MNKSQQLEQLGFRYVAGSKDLYVKMVGNTMTVADLAGHEKHYEFNSSQLPEERYHIDEETGENLGETLEFLGWQNAQAIDLAADPEILWRQ